MKEFKKYTIINEQPEIVYKALTVEKTIKLWTGFDANFVDEVGSEFSLWDGDIVDQNLKFEPNKLIQQEWFFGDQEEQSIVTFKLHEHKKGTSLEVIHSNIPDEAFEEMQAGWEDIFLSDLQDFFQE